MEDKIFRNSISEHKNTLRSNWSISNQGS